MNETYLAYALILVGEAERGLEHLNRAAGRQVAFKPQHTRYSTVTANAYLAARRPIEARAEIDKGLALVADRHARGYRGPLLRLGAEAQAAAEQFDVAATLQTLDEALRLATELGMRPETAYTHAALSRVFRRTGDRARADEHLAAADRLFRDLGAPYWAERVAARLS
jgi:tetratricopeptide (TPR) repeat protein